MKQKKSLYNLGLQYNHMRQQLNVSSFNDLQVEQYEEQNSNPSHFVIRAYDQEEFALQATIELSDFNKHNLSHDPYLEAQPLFHEEQIINESSTNHEQNQKNSDNIGSPSQNQQIESQSAHDSKSNQSNTTQISPQKVKKANKRQNNNNNAHKYFTTLLNKACNDCGILVPLKKILKKRQIILNKGSRQVFIIRLIQISMVFPNQGVKIKKCFLNILAKGFNKKKNGPALIYLNGLKQVYRNAIELFYEGMIIQATKCIYQIQNAKQKLKEKQGIKKVEEFMEKYGYS